MIPLLYQIGPVDMLMWQAKKIMEWYALDSVASNGLSEALRPLPTDKTPVFDSDLRLINKIGLENYNIFKYITWRNKIRV